MTREETVAYENAKLDDIRARAGEMFGDYLIVARTSNGRVAWRSSDVNWAESAAREYIQSYQMGTMLQQIEEFKRREG